MHSQSGGEDQAGGADPPIIASNADLARTGAVLPAARLSAGGLAVGAGDIGHESSGGNRARQGSDEADHRIPV
jgi:hypothetical protein